jgi:hypothetical protein
MLSAAYHFRDPICTSFGEPGFAGALGRLAKARAMPATSPRVGPGTLPGPRQGEIACFGAILPFVRGTSSHGRTAAADAVASSSDMPHSPVAVIFV